MLTSTLLFCYKKVPLLGPLSINEPTVNYLFVTLIRRTCARSPTIGWSHRLLFMTIASMTLCLTGCASLGNFSPLNPLEKSLIYHPSEWPTDFKISENGPVEEAWITTEDGTKIHGLFIEHPHPKGIALVCHGNAGNVADRISSLANLNQAHQLSVLMFDYRGFGKSSGKPDEQGLYMDARAARKWLAERTGAGESDIIMMGRSLGGGVAVELAAKDGAKALVLASTFTSLPDVAKQHARLLPTGFMMTQRLDSANKIKDYFGPLLQSHGRADRLIPIEIGRKLHAAAPGKKRFIEVEGGHNAPQSPEYHEALEELLNSLAQK